MGGRAFEIIEVLVESAGMLVTKEDLMASVWPGAAIEDNTLQVHISAVRRAFGRDSSAKPTGDGLRPGVHRTIRVPAGVYAPFRGDLRWPAMTKP